MSKNHGRKREIIPLDEVPRSSTPEPATKRPRISRPTSQIAVPDSSRSDESRARATRRVKASAAGVRAPRGASRGRPARTPSAERSSGEESVAEGLLPAAEGSSGEELVAVDGSPLLEPRTPAAERSSGEESVAEGLLPAAISCHTYGDWMLIRPRARRTRLVTDDSGWHQGQWLLNGPQERSP
jgi:hypothetical protein